MLTDVKRSIAIYIFSLWKVNALSDSRCSILFIHICNQKRAVIYHWYVLCCSVYLRYLLLFNRNKVNRTTVIMLLLQSLTSSLPSAEGRSVPAQVFLVGIGLPDCLHIGVVHCHSKACMHDIQLTVLACRCDRKYRAVAWPCSPWRLTALIKHVHNTAYAEKTLALFNPRRRGYRKENVKQRIPVTWRMSSGLQGHVTVQTAWNPVRVIDSSQEIPARPIHARFLPQYG